MAHQGEGVRWRHGGSGTDRLSKDLAHDILEWRSIIHVAHPNIVGMRRWWMMHWLNRKIWMKKDLWQKRWQVLNNGTMVHLANYEHQRSKWRWLYA